MKVLVLNAGSSSLKYQVIDMDNEEMLGSGLVERIGSAGGELTQKSADKKHIISVCQDMKDHTEAFELVMKALIDAEDGLIKGLSEIGAIGHRVLHSGEDFKSSVLVTEEVLKTCDKNAVLGPLHMPANIACIRSCMKLMPGIPNVAVFDTVFHSTMPDYAYMYAIKYEDYEQYKVRKYGFHGTSHRFLTGETLKLLGNPAHSKIVTCHLGNGSSLAAVLDGKCIDTTMGLTPLEGLVMGTRSGDIDPAAVGFLAEQKGKTASEIVTYLNKECGFQGICGKSDCRDLTALMNQNDYKATLAMNMLTYRIRKYIGAYAVALGGLDAIVFSGGIGEHSNEVREFVMKGLEPFGAKIDYDRNNELSEKRIGGIQELSTADSKIKVFVIPTNEELMIARDALELSK